MHIPYSRAERFCLFWPLSIPFLFLSDQLYTSLISYLCIWVFTYHACMRLCPHSVFWCASPLIVPTWWSVQDEDFVVDKDDEGSPTDDSGEEESDASESGGEKEARHLVLIICIMFKKVPLKTSVFSLTEWPFSEACQKGFQKRTNRFQGIFFQEEI